MPLLLPADEKYNFERLQRSTVLNKQPLLAPQPLELSPTEELTVRCGRVPCLLVLPRVPARQLQQHPSCTALLHVWLQLLMLPLCAALPHPAGTTWRCSARMDSISQTTQPLAACCWQRSPSGAPRCCRLWESFDSTPPAAACHMPDQLRATCLCSSLLLLLALPTARTSLLV
jgi:hypothetical protein